MSQIIQTAEPFFFLGDSTKPACLLVHGFTGAPKEMRLLGEFLNQHGYTCLGVRLTGHATTPEDMVRSRYTDWIWLPSKMVIICCAAFRKTSF